MPEVPSGTLTFLFTDIEGSTRLWQEHPAAMGAALARHDALLGAVVADHRGRVFKTVGDAVCAAFPAAADALAAAVAAQHLLQREPWGETGPLLVRMALHSGEAEARDGDYFGQPLNRIARLLSAGHGGQILLSLPAAELVRDGLPSGASLRDLGLHRLKDLARPEHIFQLVVPDLPDAFPRLRTLDSRPHNLPAEPTPLLGRTEQVAAARALLATDEVRLLTLTGPGGIGKTRLGIHIAADLLDTFADGVWFVPLAPITDHHLVLPTIATTLGIRESGSQPLAARLAAALREGQRLLVLDNFEHVMGAVPDVGDLLQACPHLTLLVTSRSPLRLRAEREFPVAPLAVPDLDPARVPDLDALAHSPAVELFVLRVQAANPRFALTAENAPAVAAICARLDGLPLAIELAASRAKLLSPAKLLARLEKRLPLLTGGAADLPARQQTLRAAIAWSYDLLSLEKQTLFRRLAVCAGGCSLETAEAIAAGAAAAVGDALDGVLALVDESLLRQQDGADGEPRFTMLETIREFGLERLAEQGEDAAARADHAAHFLELAETAAPSLAGPDQATWLAHLETEHDNLRAALTWTLDRGDREDAVRLVAALSWFWFVRGHLAEGRSWSDRALAAAGDERTAARGKALHGGGWLAHGQGDDARAAELFAASLAVCRALRDEQGMAAALNGLANVAHARGDDGAALNLYQESLALHRARGDRRGVAATLSNLAAMAAEQGDADRAADLFSESLALFRALGDQRGLAATLGNLGEVVRAQGDATRALALFQESLALRRSLGDRRGIALLLHNLGNMAAERGDVAEAAPLLREALTLRRELGDQQGVANSLEGIAELAAGHGRDERAAVLYGATDALRTRIGASQPPVKRSCHDRTVGAVRQRLGEPAFAAAWGAGYGLAPEQVIAEALDALAPTAASPLTPLASRPRFTDEGGASAGSGPSLAPTPPSPSGPHLPPPHPIVGEGENGKPSSPRRWERGFGG